LAHAGFWATHGKGFPYVAQKDGMLAQGSDSGIWPTDVDISSARVFTKGQDLVKQ
jgi:hypothetical protein